MRTERLYLRDMLQAIDDIGMFLEGVHESDFPQRLETRYAVAFALVTLGEAASHVSDDLQSRYRQIPWRLIVGQRNVIAHGYFALSWEDIWATATHDVPSIRPVIVNILAEEFGDVVED